MSLILYELVPSTSSISVVLIHEMGVFIDSNTSVCSGGLFMHVSLNLLAIVVETCFDNRIYPVTSFISQETEGLYLIIRANNKLYLFSPYFCYYSACQTGSFEIFKQEAMLITTFDQLGIATFCPKQTIIDVITKSKETNEL